MNRFSTLSLVVVLAVAGILPYGVVVGEVNQNAPGAGSPATKPSEKSPVSDAGLETRAAQALAAGDYPAALPLLRRMADLYKNDARRLAAVEEQIKLCEFNIANGIGSVVPSAETRKPHAAPVAGKTTTFDKIQDLGNFEYDAEKGGGIPNDVKALSNTTVKLRGYMIPMDQAENITTFALVPSLFACCFGQPPSIQHTVIVYTPKGKAVSYYPDEIMVEGKLVVEEKKEEGFIVSVFEMTAASIKPAGR